MAHTYREARHVRMRDPDTETRTEYGLNILANVVYTIGGIIMSVLGIRFLLSILGANRANEFASFIYNVSHPFVAPFFGLFNYQEQFGVSRFEFETLIAIAFWGFVTWMIARLMTVGSRRAD